MFVVPKVIKRENAGLLWEFLKPLFEYKSWVAASASHSMMIYLLTSCFQVRILYQMGFNGGLLIHSDGTRIIIFIINCIHIYIVWLKKKMYAAQLFNLCRYHKMFLFSEQGDQKGLANGIFLMPYRVVFFPIRMYRHR